MPSTCTSPQPDSIAYGRLIRSGRCVAERALPTIGPMTERWYARDADAVASGLDANLEAGLSAEQVKERLERLGPNALPTEEPTPGWRRFLDEYRSYMQMILVGAAVVSLAIQEWSTAVILVA